MPHLLTPQKRLLAAASCFLSAAIIRPCHPLIMNIQRAGKADLHHIHTAATRAHRVHFCAFSSSYQMSWVGKVMRIKLANETKRYSQPPYQHLPTKHATTGWRRPPWPLRRTSRASRWFLSTSKIEAHQQHRDPAYTRCST